MNRSVRIFVLLFLSQAGYVTAQEEIIHRFSLEDCINYALEHNSEIINTGKEINISRGFIRESTSDGLPQLNGHIDLADNFIVPTTFIPSIFFDPEAPSGDLTAVKFSPQYSGSVGITLNQMIFDGSFFVGLEAARTYRELSVKEHVKTKIDVVTAVTKAYYTVLWSMESRELIATNYNRLDSLLNDTEMMYENGFVEKIDVNRIKVRLNNMRVQKNNSQRQLAIAYMLLKFQMGMPVQEHIVLTDSFEEMKLNVESIQKKDYQYSDRVEYSILKTNKNLALLDKKLSISRYYPKFDLTGSLGASTGTNNLDNYFNISDQWFGLGSVGVQASIPIFDGLRKSSRIQQNKLKIEQIDESFRQLENSIDLQVNQTQLKLANSLENMEAQKENMALAEEVFEVAREKYQQGVGSNIEVIEADTSYKEAQLNYFSALYDALVAYVDLQKALGITLDNYQKEN